LAAQDIEHPAGDGRRAEAAKGGRFSTYLRHCRRERRLSLRQVEKLSESYPERISNSYLAYCETGRLLPSLGKLMTLARVLGVPLQSFTERLEIDRDAASCDAALAMPSGLPALREEGIRRAEAGALREAYLCFEAGLEAAVRARDDGARADLMMDMAIVLKRMSRHYTARDLLEEVVSRRGLDAARVDRALLLLADVLREMDRLPIAAMIGREALHRASRQGDPDREAHAACLLGNALYDMGCVDEAIPLYERAIRFFRTSPDARSSAPLVCNMANLANCLLRMEKGERGARFSEGLRLLAEAEAIARSAGFQRQTADILGYQARAHGLLGQAARAEKLFFQSNRIARECEYHDILFTNTWHLRELALKQRRQDMADDHLRTLRYLRSRVDSSNPEIRAFDRLSRAVPGTAPGEDGAVS